MANKGVVMQNNAEDEASVTAKVQAVISLMNNASTANTAETKKALDEAKASIAASSLTTAEKQRISTILEHAKPEDKLNFYKSIIDSGGLDVDGQLAQNKLRAKFIATPITEQTTGKTLNFISDVNPNGDSSQQALKDYAKFLKGQLRPVARIDTMQTKQVGIGIESSSNSGIQKLSGMFSLALHSSYDVSFARTSLTIKGDPFWLFPQPIINDTDKIYNSLKSTQAAIDWIKNAHKKVDSTVNINGTDNFIIVRFRTPKIFNIDENPDSNNPFADVETLSGVFKVVAVVSKFEGGKFHQDLDCILDYNINIINFMDEIEANTKKIDTPTVASDLTLKNSLADNTKSPRLFSESKDALQATIQPITLAGANLGSNIPQLTPNILSGLPDTFK
jgi:hypothetical protein